MTLRLSPAEDDRLTRLADRSRLSKNAAAARAIGLEARREDHPVFVHRTTARLLDRYSGLMEQLAGA